MDRERIFMCLTFFIGLFLLVHTLSVISVKLLEMYFFQDSFNLLLILDIGL
jgi:hypothetical protein